MDAFILFFGYSVTTVVTQQITNKTKSCLELIYSWRGGDKTHKRPKNDCNKQMAAMK